MSSINKTVTLNWNGEEYSLLITMRHIDLIEEELNLMKMVQRCSNGDLRFSHAAKLISTILTVAGAKGVTQEDVFAAMFQSGTEVDPADIVDMVSNILDAMFPRSKKNTTGKKTQKK